MTQMMKYKQKGWFGHSHEHAMAARGMKLYARKEQVLVNPVFYAQKREEEVAFNTILDEVRDGATYSELLRKHPHADKEDLRIRGIKAVESREGNNSLSTLNSNGVDASVHMAQHNQRTKEKMLETLNDHQKSSFLQVIKVDLLKKRLTE
jgi:hypothetical protein